MDLWHENMSVLHDLLLNLQVNEVKIPRYHTHSLLVDIKAATYFIQQLYTNTSTPPPPQ